MSELIFDQTEEPITATLPENLIFGKIFTPHIFEMDFHATVGMWSNPSIKKLHKMEMNPASLVLHYGQAIFEGLKAYKQVDGRIAIFRPEENFMRFNRSAKKMCIPEIDIDFIKNKNVIPHIQGCSKLLSSFFYIIQ